MASFGRRKDDKSARSIPVDLSRDVPKEQPKKTKPEKNEMGTPGWAQKANARLQSAASKRPERVSVDDVRARWDEAAPKFEERVALARQPKYLKMGLCGLLIAGSMGFALNASNTSDSHKAKMHQYNTQLSSLNSQFQAGQQAKPNPVVANQAQGASELKDIKKTGDKIASLQQQYDGANLHDGSITKISNQMAGYFDQYTNSAKAPWYTIYRGKGNPHSNVKFQWKFSTPYGFINSGNNVSVVWTCTNKANGEMLAYALGSYNTNEKKFDGMSYGMTTVGQSYVGDEPDSYGNGYGGDTGKSKSSTPKAPSNAKKSDDSKKSNSNAKKG